MTPTLDRGPAVVALGGGHGLAASLRALRRVTSDLTAVVTVADDGGSSGRLRAQFDILPPGRSEEHSLNSSHSGESRMPSSA